MQSLVTLYPHLVGLVIQLPGLSISLVLLTVVFAPLEQFFPARPSKLFRKAWAQDLGWYFINGLTPAFLLGPPASLLAFSIHAILPAGLTGSITALPLWARMLAAMAAGEAGFYWGHRLSHQIPFLWRFHAVHHSAEHVNFLVNTRAHPLDMVFTRFCGLVPLYALGLAAPAGRHPTLVPALVLFIGSMWSFFIHANLRWRLGWIEHLITTPGFHHWHHTRDDHRDHNYASMLPVMDRIFGTLYLPREWPAAYGADTPVPADLAGQLLSPFARQSKAQTCSIPSPEPPGQPEADPHGNA